MWFSTAACVCTLAPWFTACFFPEHSHRKQAQRSRIPKQEWSSASLLLNHEMRTRFWWPAMSLASSTWSHWLRSFFQWIMWPLRNTPLGVSPTDLKTVQFFLACLVQHDETGTVPTCMAWVLNADIMWIHQNVDVIVLRKEHGTDWYLNKKR